MIDPTIAHSITPLEKMAESSTIPQPPGQAHHDDILRFQNALNSDANPESVAANSPLSAPGFQMPTLGDAILQSLDKQRTPSDPSIPPPSPMQLAGLR